MRMLVPGGRVGALDSRVSSGPMISRSLDRSPPTSRMSWGPLWLAFGPLDMCFSLDHGQQTLTSPCKPDLQMGLRLCLLLVTARTISESGAVGDPICKEWNSQPPAVCRRLGQGQ